MHIPLAKYGMQEIALSAVGSAILGVSLWFFHPAAILLPVAFFIWVLAFFRNPRRPTPGGEETLVAPADGTVIFVDEVDEPEFIGGRALKIGIFLSVFNAHLNRAPITGRIAYLRYNRGKFLNALNDESSVVNENQLIGMESTVFPGMRVLVKQISGAIARRIVTDVVDGQTVPRGQIIGMIKFGSRTEIYIPAAGAKKFVPAVQKKAKIKAGLTVLGTWQ